MAVCTLPDYLVRRTIMRPGIGGKWNSPSRQHANALRIACALDENTPETPAVSLKMLYDAERLYGVFRIQGADAACRKCFSEAGPKKRLCLGLCLQPTPESACLLFEMNCGGYLQAAHVSPDGVRQETPWAWTERVDIYGDVALRMWRTGNELPERHVEFAIPFSYVTNFTGAEEPCSGQTWRANVYHCRRTADATFTPQASWAPVNEDALTQPAHFGCIHFE